MRKNIEILFILHSLLLALDGSTAVQEKAGSTSGPPLIAYPPPLTSFPTTTAYPPPEGNTTFLGGTTWCVARPGVSQNDLQKALDWACGRGMVDCGPLQRGGICFEPDTLVSHASYAFNSYYQQNGNNDVACNFGGTGVVTHSDPSYGKCSYATSGRASSPETSSSLRFTSNFDRWNLLGILVLFLYL
ncbi:hypothetical protein Sjap_026301 [Stephania japonica]|uniref:X8 domain-containing protein n=1 Tax=Stephania japonica TaxID=461633 RepID=A0AAP0HKB7_9MAGN